MSQPDVTELRKPTVDKTAERVGFIARLLRLFLIFRKAEKSR